MNCQEIVKHLQSLANPVNVAGMARYGINPFGTLGVSIPMLRQLARQHRKNHPLALELWESGIHEARILASLVDDPHQVTESQIEQWAWEIDSWDICDQCCSNLFARTFFAWEKAVQWSSRPEEFVKRAGFVLIARLAVQEKKADDHRFLPFLPLIRREAVDERNFVKKGVNWALRQIGKRQGTLLRREAIILAEELSRMESKSARWIGRDALRELTTNISKG